MELLHSGPRGRVIARHEVADHQCNQYGPTGREDGDGPEARLARQVILRVEVHADKTAITALAIVDGHMRGQKRAVVVLLEIGTDIGLAGGDLSQPVAVVTLIKPERLHIVR